MGLLFLQLVKAGLSLYLLPYLNYITYLITGLERTQLCQQLFRAHWNRGNTLYIMWT